MTEAKEIAVGDVLWTQGYVDSWGKNKPFFAVKVTKVARKYIYAVANHGREYKIDKERMSDSASRATFHRDNKEAIVAKRDAESVLASKYAVAQAVTNLTSPEIVEKVAELIGHKITKRTTFFEGEEE